MSFTEKKQNVKNCVVKKINSQETDYASPIYNIKKELLLPPQSIENIESTEITSLSQEGFVVGDLTINDYENWIKNESNTVVVALSNESDLNSLLGYSITLDTPGIHDEVIGYAEHVQFEKDSYNQTIQKKDFCYLIQIAVAKDVANQGIGSQLLQYTFSKVNKPIISFVVKKPIRNEPSLYVHLRNGFNYMGEYSGPYSKFEEYLSIGLIHYPDSPRKTKQEVLLLMDKIYSP